MFNSDNKSNIFIELYDMFKEAVPYRSFRYLVYLLLIAPFLFDVLRLIFDENDTNPYLKLIDTVGLIFASLTFVISLYFTLRIQAITKTMSKDFVEKFDQKTSEIKAHTEAILKQSLNVKVLNSFQEIMNKLNSLYDTTINAEDSKIPLNGSLIRVPMKLKIMNHTASFGRILCSDVEVLKSFDSDFQNTTNDKVKLKNLIQNVRNTQKDVFIKMKDAFAKIQDKNNKYYITITANKNTEGFKTTDINEIAYNKKYLSKLNVETDTCYYKNYDSNSNIKFIHIEEQKNFSQYLIDNQSKQIKELSKICKVFDAYSFKIPFQAFLTLPVDENITDENFYQCIFFFINDNTIGKGLQLSAITTKNIAFVKGISQVLDAEINNLDEFIE